MFVCGTIKPNSTEAKQGWSKPSIQTKPNQTSPNQTFSTINSKLTATNKFKSKVPEKLARAAQLLYRPVLVYLLNFPVTTEARQEGKLVYNLLTYQPIKLLNLTHYENMDIAE